MSVFHKDYYERCGELFLVYKWDRKWNRYVNTHAYPVDMENAEQHAKNSCRKVNNNHKQNKTNWRKAHA